MYQVSGYTTDCQDFHCEFDSFTEALRFYRDRADWCTIFFSCAKPKRNRADINFRLIRCRS